MAKIKKEGKAPVAPATADDKKAKREARMAKLKARPAGQRTNSKQIDVIETSNGVIKNYGYPIRGKGVLVTSIALDDKGKVVSTSVTLVEGSFTVKTKKGHGIIRPVKGIPTEIEVEGDAEEDTDTEED